MRLAGATLALGLMAGCQTAPPALKPSDSAFDIEVVTSPGGVTAWLVSEDFVPIVAMEVAWKGGSTIEQHGHEGAGWVLAYMMNEGAGDMDTGAYAARMDDLGMEFGCGVAVDWTMCHFSTLKETAGQSFEMARLAFADLRFDDEPFDRAKREFAVKLKEEETNPRAVASRTMTSTLIAGHPYSRFPTPETVMRVTKDETRTMMSQLMTRDRLLVVVVGDITAEELKPKLDHVFGVLPATSTLASVADAHPVPAPADPIVKRLPTPQTLVMFSGPGVKRSDPDFYAAYVLNYILGGGGFSSRLTDDIRDKRGLTYSIGSSLSLQQHLSRWTGSSSTMNDKANEVVRLIRENIDRLGREGPTEKELADAKSYLTGAFPLAFDSNAKIARNLMGFRQDDLGVDYVGQRNAFIEAVTLEDLKRVAATYMKSENFTFVLVGQPK